MEAAPLFRLLRTATPVFFGLLLLAACAGPEGSIGLTGGDGERGPAGTDGDHGEDGSDGEDGEDGGDGEDGEDVTIPDFVGSDACGACHEEQYNKVIRSGHRYAMVPTSGVAPAPPAEFAGEYPDDPPDGSTWADISYLIGGWAWKVLFVDADGYQLTGGMSPPYTDTQYNLETGFFVEYEAGTPEGSLPTSCATCHATAWSIDGNEDGLPGLVGTWSEPGVGCEECHGAGGNHVEHPQQVRLAIQRDAEACGSCHSQGPEARIPASDGFGHNGQQWNEMANSKHRALDCVDCHDPHASATTFDAVWNREVGIISECASCHFREAANMNSVSMANFECTECHMPSVTRSAMGDGLEGDVSTHLFAINTDPAAEQFFDEDGEEFMSPFLTLEYACVRCHSDDGIAFTKTDEELEGSAAGFHTPVD